MERVRYLVSAACDTCQFGDERAFGSIKVILKRIEDIHVGDIIVNGDVSEIFIVRSRIGEVLHTEVTAESLYSDMVVRLIDQAYWVKNGVTIKEFNIDDEIRKQLSESASVIDTEGLEHCGVETAYVSKEDWDKWKSAGRIGSICGVDPRDAQGPGIYYCRGSEYLTGNLRWALACTYCMEGSRAITTQQQVYGVDQLDDVKFVVYRRDLADPVSIKSISKHMCRQKLASLLRSGDVSAPACHARYEVRLVYTSNGITHSVQIINKTSDNDNEWFEWPIDGDLVYYSIVDGIDTYGSLYLNEAKVYMEKHGTVLPMSKFLHVSVVRSRNSHPY